jgi:hypothetical protein
MAQILSKAAWPRFLERLSRELVGKRAEIEIASLEIGDQIEADWLPLFGIAYDPKNDLIEIALEGVDHLIRNPVSLAVECDWPIVSSIEIVDREGAQQIIRLRDPLMLSATRQ